MDTPTSPQEQVEVRETCGEPGYIVGLGASAGGLEALQQFFEAMPSKSGLAFVIIQHLSPHFKSMMDELLSRHTEMPITVVSEPTAIQRDHIYLLPPGFDMVLDGGTRLSVRGKLPHTQLQTPISDFFHELGRQLGERSVAIVLSGTGSDGSTGVRTVWEHGGLVLVQHEKSAKFESMPNHAVATGLAHSVVPPVDLPAELLRLLRSRAGLDLDLLDGGAFIGGSRTPYQLQHQILSRLDRAFDLNFAQYKSETIRRRIERRITISNLNSVESYVDKLENDTEELNALYNDLLIGVTRFMRDPEAFALIRDQVIPQLLEKHDHREEIRLWIAGCATGEEAYSIAILFLEVIEELNLSVKLRVFATDRHRDSLRIAGEGRYSSELLKAMPQALAAKYFSPDGADHYRVVGRLRKCLVFSSHNILKDPPFTNIDLVSCRNLLIYFRPQAQRRVLGVLYFALRTGGYMFLGPSESHKDFEREFRCVSSRWKIYEKITSYRISAHFSRPHLPSGELLSSSPSRPPQREPWLTRAYNELLKRYIPTGALITDNRIVLHLFGEAQDYLRPPEGRMTQDIVDMADGNLKIAVSSVIQRVVQSGEAVDLRSVEVRDVKGNERIIDVRAETLHDRVSKTDLYLVLLLNERSKQDRALPIAEPSPIALPRAENTRTFDSSTEANERIDVLESELSHARQSLQSAVEELETSNEELQSSNEELLASNEELQSTNEELHSVNEELYSVNAEHEQKIHELHSVTGDLRNLMQATDVGLIFTDKDLRIRLYTPKATEILNLLPQDVGREISHITSKVRADSLSNDICRAAEEICTLDARVQLDDGRVFLRRIKPYVDLDHEAAGLILTFVEITDLHRAQARQAETEQRVRLATRASGVGTWEWHKGSDTVRWDERMFELYGLKPTQGGSINAASWRACVNPRDWQKLEQALDNPSASHQSFEIAVFHGIQREERIVRVDLTSRPDPLERDDWLLGTHFDVTQERRIQAKLQENEARHRSMIEHSPHGIVLLNAKGEISQVNPEFARIFGGSETSFVGQSLSSFFEYDNPGKDSNKLGAASALGQEPIIGFRRDTSRVPLEIRQSEIRVKGHRQTLLFVSDLTEEQRSAQRRQQLASIVENTDDAILSASPNGTIRSWNQGAQRIYGYSAEEIVGKNLSALVESTCAAEHQGLIELVSQGRVVRNREVRRIRKDQSLVDIAVTLSPMFGERGNIIGISATERDISEQKRQQQERQRIEQKMIESAKLESLGVLAGGIAHDFNNLLSGIMGSTSVVEGILKKSASQDVALQRNMKIIRDASARAAELCHQLLAYSGRGRFLIERHDLSSLVRDTSELIASSIAKNIELHFELSEDLPKVSMDATQVRQVVMNLVINASEAMGESPGDIFVRTGLRVLESESNERSRAAFKSELEPGRYVTLSVQDTGCGIEAEKIERVFDPFFTTKFTGRGLGLSAVLGIARGHDGGLWVDSEPGRGTTFTLFLRAKDNGVEARPPTEEYDSFRGEGKVLVVDDEPILRESLGFLLEALGYEVRHAADGIEALSMLEKEPSAFTLVILDLTMPRLNGTQTLHELRRSGNQVPVMLMSGFHRNEATAAIDETLISGFIPKPFDRGALVSALRKCFPAQAKVLPLVPQA